MNTNVPFSFFVVVVDQNVKYKFWHPLHMFFSGGSKRNSSMLSWRFIRINRKTNTYTSFHSVATVHKAEGVHLSHTVHMALEIFVHWACIGRQPGSPWLVNAHYGNKVFIGAIRRQQGGDIQIIYDSRSDWMISYKVKISEAGPLWQLKGSVREHNNEQWFPHCKYSIYMEEHWGESKDDASFETLGDTVKMFCVALS